MKLGEIQKIYTALGTTLEKKLPLKVGFVINRNIKKMQPIIEDLDKTRDDAVNKYGEHDEEGKLVKSDTEIDPYTDPNSYTQITGGTMQHQVGVNENDGEYPTMIIPSLYVGKSLVTQSEYEKYMT